MNHGRRGGRSGRPSLRPLPPARSRLRSRSPALPLARALSLTSGENGEASRCAHSAESGPIPVDICPTSSNSNRCVRSRSVTVCKGSVGHRAPAIVGRSNSSRVCGATSIRNAESVVAAASASCGAGGLYAGECLPPAAGGWWVVANVVSSRESDHAEIECFVELVLLDAYELGVPATMGYELFCFGGGGEGCRESLLEKIERFSLPGFVGAADQSVDLRVGAEIVEAI